MNDGKIPEYTMVRQLFVLGLLFLLQPHYAATAPEVSANIESNKPVKEGQAAYVNGSRLIREVRIKCSLPNNEQYTKYEIYRRRNNETQGTLVHDGKPELDNTGTYIMKKDKFLAGAYWCVGEGEEGKTPHSDFVYLGSPPKVTLKQLQPYPEEGGTARFVCEVEDDLTSFSIDRKLVYLCVDCSDDHPGIPVPREEWKHNGTELEIANVTRVWAMDARAVCRVTGLKVRDSTTRDFDPNGFYYNSDPVAIMFYEPPLPPDTSTVLGLSPPHFAATVIVGGIVLLALAVLVLVLLVMVVVRKRSRTQPAVDAEYGPPNGPHLGPGSVPGEGCRRPAPEDLGPVALLPPSVPGHPVSILPGACDSDWEQWQQARGYS